MVESTSRTLVCSVLFLDIAEYSRKPVAEQLQLKQAFNRILGEALEQVAPRDRIILDTGDGAAVTFMGDPEDALFAAMSMRDMCGTVPVRAGVNLGPVRLVKDLNAVNIIGDGINVAQRVMSFASPGQLLVSRSFYEVVSCLSRDYASLFRHEGQRTDKHVRDHEVYSVGGTPSTRRLSDTMAQTGGHGGIRHWLRGVGPLGLRRSALLAAPLVILGPRAASLRVGVRPPAPRLSASGARGVGNRAAGETCGGGENLPRRGKNGAAETVVASATRSPKTKTPNTVGAAGKLVLVPPGRVSWTARPRHQPAIQSAARCAHHRDPIPPSGSQAEGAGPSEAMPYSTLQMTGHVLLTALLVAALAGCAQIQSVSPLSKGRSDLNEGIRQYDEGQHLAAAKSLQSALDLGLSDRQRADAHKHLAFIHCSGGRAVPCRDEFRKALAADPDLALAPAEAGHPVWGPIFKAVKAESASFSVGLKQFDDGDYDASAKSLQTALDRGLPPKDQVDAYKHLAFIHCANNRIAACRDEFRKALTMDPSLELAAAEAGHPVWGPIFRSLKAGR